MDPSVMVMARAMLEEINKSESPKNVVVSPLSLSALLSVLAFGANGETLQQFLRFLGAQDTEELLDKSRAIFALLSSSADGNAETSRSLNRPQGSQDSGADPPESPAMETFNRGHVGREPLIERPWSSDNNRVELLEAPDSPLPFSRADDIQMRSHHGREPDFSMANAIWVDHSCRLKPSFVEIAQSEFRASVKNVDLQNESEQVWKDVNAWAEKETKGLIKDLLSETSKPGPPLCLANALYFEGAWLIPFEASDTRDEDFHLLNAQTTEVPFMIMYDERLSYGSFPDFKLLKLPYQQGKTTNKQLSMYIFLPHQRDGLRSLLEKFRFGCTSLLLENLHLKREELSHVWIPKMKFSYTFEEIQDHIKAVGLTRPFLEYGADFSKMASSSEHMYIKSILQKCLIEVNEEGTEAAAVTVCTMGYGCAMSSTPPPPRPSFVADHPFMFMIIEDFTKNIAFTGAVLNPLLTE